MTPKYPDITMQLTGTDGNAFGARAGESRLTPGGHSPSHPHAPSCVIWYSALRWAREKSGRPDVRRIADNGQGENFQKFPSISRYQGKRAR